MFKIIVATDILVCYTFFCKKGRRRSVKLNLESITNPALRREWEQAGYKLPHFDVMAMREKTAENCRWVHFGSGNIFRAYLGAKMQDLLDRQLAEEGIVVGEGFDWEMIEKGYHKFDNLSIDVTLKGDGTVEKRILASIAEALRCSTQLPAEWERMSDIFCNPALQMASFTITEKGYSITAPFVQEDIPRGPEKCITICCMVTALIYKRFLANAFPVAIVSMDNCSRNGEKLRNAIVSIANKWNEMGFVSDDFIAYLTDEQKVSFPWSMIDKITPRPDPSVCRMLQDDGFADAEVVVTSCHSYVSSFVNTEECEYLVIEDNFPNGRPALDKVGVYFTDRDTVTKVERMKVCTCLNPLHTAMSIAGCLLGYNKISDEMKDPDIVSYIRKLGYKEGLPVVTDPGIISPKSFIDDVVNKRLPNPFMPDTPQRIATDTSQKLAIRFGETVKSYLANPSLDVMDLKCIPFACASWIRYLLAVNDDGAAFEPSPDPLLDSARADISGVSFGTDIADDDLDRILARTDIWGYDLGASKLKPAVVSAFRKMNKGPHAVRKTLEETVRE